MQPFLLRINCLLIAVVATVPSLYAQQDSSQPTSVDPRLMELMNARVPKEYTIAGLSVTGITHLDTSIVLSISMLQVGDKIMIPGDDVFARSVRNLWKQRFFSNVQVFITKVEDDKIWVEVSVTQRPLLGGFEFTGIKKSEEEELQAKITLVRQTIITENLRRNIVEISTKYFRDKGYENVKVWIEEKPDHSYNNNSNFLTIHIDKGEKVRIDEITFLGNDHIDAQKLKKQMRGTKEMSKFTLHPSKAPGHENDKRMDFGKYIKDWGFLSFSKTKQLLDPYCRVKLFSSAKFNQEKLEEDKDRILRYYNSLGFRDAKISDSIITGIGKNQDGLYVNIKVNEGRRYYFGNIKWKGNVKYSDQQLNNALGIAKGDVYNVDILNRRLGKELGPDGGADISSSYLNDGYLFFKIDAVETAVYNDTIDHEIRIAEGTQARIDEITVSGNDRTKEHVIRRDLSTLPGDLFNRANVIRSIRELGTLGYFDPATISPNIVPDAERGTVDINWQVQERSNDQFELSMGWGGNNVGVTGTIGFTFNNISLKNFFRKKSWDPVPQGDGQKLSMRFQSNARIFSSYNLSFTEPWLGGKKRNSLTFSIYKSKFSHGFDPVTGLPDKERSKTNYLKTLGASVSLGKQLRWPDDYFTIVYSLNYTRYKLKDYSLFPGLNNGVSNNISFKIALNRNSVGHDPNFPTTGSNFTSSVQFTLPYSVINPSLVSSGNPYKNPEYHKWRFGAEWYVPIGQALGADGDRQFVLKMAAKFGFMGRFNKKLDYSPFERFQLGDAGLTNNYGLLGYDIIAQRGYPVYESSDPRVNPDAGTANQFFTLFNKYQLEMRYPFVRKPGSTIYGLAFFEAANGWYSFKDYNPFRLRRSVGVGMRFQLPMFGTLGFDYGVGLDRINPASRLKNVSRFTIMLGIEPE